jgi:hypothetical protein
MAVKMLNLKSSAVPPTVVSSSVRLPSAEIVALENPLVADTAVVDDAVPLKTVAVPLNRVKATELVSTAALMLLISRLWAKAMSK